MTMSHIRTYHPTNPAYDGMDAHTKRLRLIRSSGQVSPEDMGSYRGYDISKINSSCDLSLTHTLTDQCGLVAKVYLNSITMKISIKISFQEKELGSVQTDAALRNFWIINSHIFALGPEKDNAAALYEWDETGKLLRRAILKDVASFPDETPRWTIAWNANFIALIVNSSAKIFISDLMTQNVQTQCLNSSTDQVQVGCAMIHRNRLIIGSNHKKTPDDKESICKITLFNLYTNQKEVFETTHKDASIAHITATGMKVFFITHKGGKEVLLSAMNLIDGTQETIRDLPDIDKIESSVTLSVNDHSLIVCYPTSTADTDTSIFYHQVIELKQQDRELEIR